MSTDPKHFILPAFLPHVAVEHRHGMESSKLCGTSSKKRFHVVSKWRMDLPVISVLTEIGVATALGTGIYFFLFRDTPNATTSQEAEESETEPRDEGVLGLVSIKSGGSSSSSAKASFKSKSDPTPIPSAPQINTIGAIVSDFLDSSGSSATRQSRFEEELQWAANSLQDLNELGGLVIVDTDGDVVHSSGDLVLSTDETSSVVHRVSETGRKEVLQTQDNKLFPFLKNTVRSVAVQPIGSGGAVMVLASIYSDFYTSVEDRLVEAVCARLGAFMRGKLDS